MSNVGMDVRVGGGWVHGRLVGGDRWVGAKTKTKRKEDGGTGNIN